MRVGRARVHLMRFDAHRVLQRAGHGKPERWRDGFCLKLTRHQVLIVVWRFHNPRRTHCGPSREFPRRMTV